MPKQSKDRTVQPELHRFVAKRMGATTVEVESSMFRCYPNLPLCST
jgi:hypothetical protein